MKSLMLFLWISEKLVPMLIKKIFMKDNKNLIMNPATTKKMITIRIIKTIKIINKTTS